MHRFTDTELREEWEKEVDLDDVLQHYIMPNGHKIEEYWLSKFNAYKQSIRAEIEGKGVLVEQVPHHSPYISGVNTVVRDLLDSPLLK